MSPKDLIDLITIRVEQSTPRSRTMDGSLPDNVKVETINLQTLYIICQEIYTVLLERDYMLILSMIYDNNNKDIKAGITEIGRS